ncbi:MAG: hypothetical protein ACOYCB_07240 [Fastidiosipilaceae bacterium]|jgi:hexokinase
MAIMNHIRTQIPPSIYDNVYQYLTAANWPCDGLNLEKETTAFRENLQYGLNHWDTVMHMFPSFINVSEAIPVNETAIVIDAGGTNLRLATVYFDDQYEPIIEHFEQHLMPGMDGPCGYEEFYDILAALVEPLLIYSTKIGFCFSFATKMLPNKDGLPKPFSKELQLNAIVNRPIGQSLHEALIRRGALSEKDKFEIVILNDSVAALLGGLQHVKQEGLSVSNYIGYILGTGTNTAYIEDNSRITKLKDHSNVGRMVMNTESGTYPIENRSRFDRDLDAKTQYPNDHLFEKMISGRYKGDLLDEIISQSIKHTDLFSTAFRIAYRDCDCVNTIAMSSFIEDPYASGSLADLCAEETDRATMMLLAHAIEDRAAQLACCNIAGILTHLKPDNQLPVALIIDGSTYFKSPTFKAYLDHYFSKYINKKLNYKLQIIPSVNGNLVGATVAILTN